LQAKREKNVQIKKLQNICQWLSFIDYPSNLKGGSHISIKTVFAHNGDFGYFAFVKKQQKWEM